MELASTVESLHNEHFGNRKQFAIQRFTLFGVHIFRIVIDLDTQGQSVIGRFSLLEEFVLRGSTVPGLVHTP